MTKYDHKNIEKKVQKKWQQNKVFEVDLKQAKKPFYNLMMFPYPSGEGLHVGHTFTFGGADTYGRFMRMQGYDVFEPMGFDAFGIHSENFAIKKDLHPKELIEQTTQYFREQQMKPYGGMWDWEKELSTTDPDYYKWTQWIFTKMFKNGLAYRKESFVNWCPSCKTVLSDEQVEQKGKVEEKINVCERCKTEVVKKKTEQWFFKITEYAEKLLDYQDSKWSEATKQMQENWIGKSFGAEIDFPVQNKDLKLKVFTTRPDTLYGASFMAIAPEHPLIEKLSLDKEDKIREYIERSRSKTAVQRQAEKEKSGILTGLKLINPINGEELPLYIADYVMMEYGTGAVMGVPGHDQRDWDFAKKYDLKIIPVIKPLEETGISVEDIKEEQAYEGPGKIINSGEWNGLKAPGEINKVIKDLQEKKIGKKKVSYKIRDWCISRQRYWGPPIPMVFCPYCAERGESWFTNKKAYEHIKESPIFNEEKRLKLANTMAGWYPVEKKDLPIKLPYVKDYQPKGKGKSPLAEVEEFYKVECPCCGKKAKRETDVSDTFLDSAWYFFRYPSVNNQEVAFEKEITKKWLPVDMYIGGNEHAVLHLLYTRFITKVFADLGMIDFYEPFKQFFAHGLIIKDGAKMSKSRGNVINPNEYMEKYGADVLRMYLLFLGPYEQGGDFCDSGIKGMQRFVKRLYRLAKESANNREDMGKELKTKLHQTIKKMGDDFSTLDFNTAIASLMEFVNLWQKNKESANREVVQNISRMICPIAPYLSEELWEMCGQKGSVLDSSWPKYSEEKAKEEEVEVVVQVNGNVRGKFLLEREKANDKEIVLQMAKASENVQKYLEGKKPEKVYFVPGKLVNLVSK